MEQYDVSIVVPVHNRENIIKPCINSINAQTYDKSRWEVIFVDDASTDNTIETIESLIDKSINYRILKRPVGSGNASAPRNEGIKASSAKYLFFLDSDDYVDSELLENGMRMALRNDSDIVYVKTIAVKGRISPLRSFKVKFVDDADILKHHLARFLHIFKFFKTELLAKNNIFFPPNVPVSEDQIFSIEALSKSMKVSIIADKNYYFLQDHEFGHLSKKKVPIENYYKVFEYSLSSIYFCENIDKKIKLYNAWLIRVVERLINFCKKRTSDDKELINIFYLASSYFRIHKELFDIAQIYPNEKMFSMVFISADFMRFYQMVQELKALGVKQNILQKKLNNISGFNKCWIYKNRTIVLDFFINENKLAFDIEDSKVWIFSRSKPKSLDSLKKEVLSVSKNKYLIYDSNIDESIEITKLVTKYLEKAKKIIDEQNNNT